MNLEAGFEFDPSNGLYYLTINKNKLSFSFFIQTSVVAVNYKNFTKLKISTQKRVKLSDKHPNL